MTTYCLGLYVVHTLLLYDPAPHLLNPNQNGLFENDLENFNCLFLKKV
jgi:hypothetical protein